jgi:hypothetical protein
MDAPADRAEAAGRYGPEENWKLMPGWEATVEPQARQITR